MELRGSYSAAEDGNRTLLDAQVRLAAHAFEQRVVLGTMIESKVFSRGAELSYKTLTCIPADVTLRPLRDHIIVEPLNHTLSAIIHVIDERKPAQGIVKAVGPGRHHWKYDHQEKGKRTKAWLSKVFTPTDVKVGDLIQIEERPFETFYWGDRLHMIIREGDVCGILPADTKEHAA